MKEEEKEKENSVNQITIVWSPLYLHGLDQSQ